MLLREKRLLEAGQEIRIEKNSGGCDASQRGAFAIGEEIVFRATVPRKLGIAAVVLRIAPDGGEPVDMPFAFAAP